jgi:hypothetical protein
METFNRWSNAIFDVLLAPFGHGLAVFDLLVWPIVLGIVALAVLKAVSNQEAIARTKKQIGMHLLEIRLFSHDVVQVLKSTAAIIAKNGAYLGWSSVPMLVTIGPMVVVMVQLVAHYGYAPSPVGAVEMLRLELDPDAAVSPRDVALALPGGVALDAPAVRTADGRVFWRLRADAPGDHVLTVRVADRDFEKVWAVGGEPRRVPVKRLRGWEALLYPGEAALGKDDPVLGLELAQHTRALAWIPDGELGILLWTLVVSMAAGFALRGWFGVTF